MSFTHLHCHSHFSLLDGLSKVSDLVQTTKDLGMNSLAITDHGVMYGAIEFYNTCRKHEIKPIIGL
ncbi:MAG TPA: PHP domain-containing protein, partial [Candidatus Doudnabacteria bacterium]|nr:PHP domain-containing protein [Candidatus Doudnabacteria bacterium]